jgi:hypothetical protein
MKLGTKDGLYQVTWIGHMAEALRAMEWCHETFGQGWGEYSRGIGPGRSNIAQHNFLFHRLYHAQWFMLKWNPS